LTIQDKALRWNSSNIRFGGFLVAQIFESAAAFFSNFFGFEK